MEIQDILFLHNESGLPLLSYFKDDLDENLLSGLLTAIKEFIKELSLGGLSSFTTDEKSIYLVGRNYCTVAVISQDHDFQRIYSLAYQLGELFESNYDLSHMKVIDTSKYEGFKDSIEKVLSLNETDFLISVSEFVKKEFGGDISIKASLINNNGKKITIDIISDRGNKKHKGLMGSLATKMMKSFSEDVTFVKVIESTAGRGEVLDFLDNLKTFGRMRQKSIDEGVFPYFPAKAVIIARDYSPTVFDEIDKLPKFGGKMGIPGTHISPDAGMIGAPREMKCFIELWQWSDSDTYPTRIRN